MTHHGDPLIWGWMDEYRVMLTLSATAFERYVSAGLTRRVDFRGRPVTPTWEAEFLTWADRAKEHRRVS